MRLLGEKQCAMCNVASVLMAITTETRFQL